jgi:undecaprenyl pyrophosphate phosphatase UppP
MNFADIETCSSSSGSIATTLKTRFKYVDVFVTPIVFLAIVGGATSLIAFDIMALQQDSAADIHDTCASSSLWYYVLVAVICVMVYGVSLSQDNCYGLKSSIIPTVLLVWGSIEFWFVECVYKLNGTAIYQIAFINLILSFIGVGVSVCIGMAVCIMGGRSLWVAGNSY